MKFNWNAFPVTRDYIDGSGVISTAEKSEEFLSLYQQACELYAEGGTGELGKSHVRVRNYSY
jgi:hypothetical protein